ncbi:fimbrial biogenesis chaperone [Deefgea piscis]|uniref:fimbrial biogenesis chaperone n=1 Tax=Deefgea piscis TaxID=2739061 RepID=UPI001C810D0B|nr:fimbria/pilus periplasmic chaperone [Deefgea piscis]QZA81682.1 fimbria/pilus periplasmic chaperone [Deefgea piscis]
MQWILSLIMTLASTFLLAGEFAISPIRLDFTSQTKSQAITVSNNGNTPLRIALVLKRWTQDAAANDVYLEAQQDLIYFPRQFELQPKQKQVVRIARKSASQEQESTYRLYFNEQPSAADSAQSGNVAMVVSFGVPIFIAANPQQIGLNASPMHVEQNTLNFTLSNTGNVTQKLRQIQIGTQGAAIQQFDNWYLLPGATRQYQLPLPPNACSDQAQVIKIETDHSNIEQSLNIPLRACKS